VIAIRQIVRWPIPSLADRYSGRANGIGFLRLALAFTVLFGHSWPLALGRRNLLSAQTYGQTYLGLLAVYGFFVLSGFLITGSALRVSPPRYLWHRALRILPAFWVCLIVTAFVIAPAVALYERGDLSGFWHDPRGPFSYLRANWLLGMRQYSISGLLSDVPFGRRAEPGGAFDGSLWSLEYEMLCYLLVAALAASAVLVRAPRAMVLLTLGLFWIIVEDFIRAAGVHTRPAKHGILGPYPGIGVLDKQLVIYLTFLFLLGAVAKLYAHRLPMHGGLAALAAVIMAGSLRLGGFHVVGLPALAYLLLYAAVSLPRWLQPIGRRHDYSYGVYIYAFPVQQVAALTVGLRYGLAGNLALSVLGTMVLAVLSWHLVERPALSLKDWTPRIARPRSVHAVIPTSPAPAARVPAGPAA
jgi:peptidoglycan/LPS O-acetylase OafA/YrhL